MITVQPYQIQQQPSSIRMTCVSVCAPKWACSSIHAQVSTVHAKPDFTRLNLVIPMDAIRAVPVYAKPDFTRLNLVIPMDAIKAVPVQVTLKAISS